jgi:hypothetical protein
MIDISIIIDELIGHIITLIGITIILWYIMRKDARRQEIADSHYDKIIGIVIDTVAKQQMQHKDTILTEIKELTTVMTKTFVGIENIIIDTKDIQTEITRMTTNTVELTGTNNNLVSEISSNVKDVTSAIDRFVGEISKVNEQIRILSEKMHDGIEKGVITLNGKEQSYVNREKNFDN